MRTDAAHAHEQERDQHPEHHRQRRRSTTVKTTVRRSVCQKTWSCRTEPVVAQADADALVPDQLEQAVLLRRELDEPVERIAEDHADHDERPGAISPYGTAPRSHAAPETASPPGPSATCVPAAAPWTAFVHALRLVEHRCDVVAGRRSCLLDRQLAGEDLRQHVAEDVAVLDVDPVLRRRDEPAP